MNIIAFVGTGVLDGPQQRLVFFERTVREAGPYNS